jgi:IS30 family transposase
MVNISERPAEVADRALPGHWEGDLILGKNGRSAIGTLVERKTRFTTLLHLPGDHTAVTVRDAMITAMSQIPRQLRKTLTWDQGPPWENYVNVGCRPRKRRDRRLAAEPLKSWQRAVSAVSVR